jgi:hypothetical protein
VVNGYIAYFLGILMFSPFIRFKALLSPCSSPSIPQEGLKKHVVRFGRLGGDFDRSVYEDG